MQHIHDIYYFRYSSQIHFVKIQFTWVFQGSIVLSKFQLFFYFIQIIPKFTKVTFARKMSNHS